MVPNPYFKQKSLSKNDIGIKLRNKKEILKLVGMIAQ